MLDKVLRRSDAVDKESLCILTGQRVRSFTSPSMLVPYFRSGLAFAFNPAFSVRHRKHAWLCLFSGYCCPPALPKTGSWGSRGRSYYRAPFNQTRSFVNIWSRLQHPPSERAPVPLAIHHTPFCLTFAFFPDATIPPVLDPSQLEQRLSAGLLSIALNAQREICVLQKLGGVPLHNEEILQLVKVSAQKAKELHDMVEARLAEDWAGRTVEVRWFWSHDDGSGLVWHHYKFSQRHDLEAEWVQYLF